MRMQTEYMSFRNCWMISSINDLHVHHQNSTTRSCFSQTALWWFEVLPGLLPMLPGWSSALTDLSPALQVPPRLVITVPRLVAGAPEGHCISPVISGIWPPLDSGPTTFKHSQRPPETLLHFADVGVCCTWCMLYSVFRILGECWTQC